MRRLLSILCLLCVMPAYGQFDEQEDVLWDEDELEISEKREPSFFRRPAMKDPASQLDHAEELLENGKARKARKAYRNLTYKWPDSDQAPEAQYQYAKLLMRSQAYMKAFKEFQYLIEYYPGEFPYEQTLDYQFRIANEIRTERWGDILFLPGFSTSERSLPLYKKIAENGPNWEKTPNVWFYIGNVYEQNHDYQSAVDAYEKIIFGSRITKKDIIRQQAAYRRLECFYAMVKRQPRDQKVYQRAISGIFRFLKDYPDHEKAAEARKMLDKLKQDLEDMHYRRAQFYDNNTDKPKAALISYREFLKNFPASARAAKVEARIKELEAVTNTK